MFELKKIGFVRRASACLLDAILLAVLATGFIWIISLICNYSGAERQATEYYSQWEDFRKEYVVGETGVAQTYGFTYEENGISYTITKDGQAASLNDVINALVQSKGEGNPRMEEAYAKYLTLPPVEKVNAQYQYVYSLLFMMVSIGVLLAYVVLEFIIPVILKNGQTVGKKVFGICLVRPNCVRVTVLAVFARMLLGKFAVETMFPILLIFLFLFGGMGILAIILFAALAILNIVLFFATKNRTPIHDIFAYTVAADMRMQMIFASDEELNERKEQLHKESVEQEKNA